MKYAADTIATLVCMLLLAAASQHVLAGSVEHVTDGGFEHGLVDMEIDRYPRYPSKPALPFRIPERDTVGALSGRYSLRLPGLREGGYRLSLSPLHLQPGHDYMLTFRMAASSAVKGSIEVRHGRKKVLVENIRLVKLTEKLLSFPFRLRRDLTAAEYIVQFRIESRGDVRLDDVSVVGDGNKDRGNEPYVRLHPDSPMGVYDIGQSASMNVYTRGSFGVAPDIVIREFVTGDIVSDPMVTTLDSAEIPLFTERRGYYSVLVYCGSAERQELCAKRGYAVINNMHEASGERHRYGLAMEEHGRRSMINAAIQPSDYYSLVRNIGAGSIRIFSLAAPHYVSDDGEKYNFHQLNSSLKLAQEYGLSPLVELGSNSPELVPDWVLSKKQPANGFRMSSGIRTSKLSERMGKRADRFFDLDRYADYLDAVFRNGRGKKVLYEIWNEPGHKFTEPDIVSIAELTRNAACEADRSAVILGYSSTKGREVNVAPQLATLPGYLEEVADLGGLKFIDALSYHSAHAYRFFGNHVNINNRNTDYVERLRRLLNEHDAGNMEIWDTERGVPWYSPRLSGRQRPEAGGDAGGIHVQSQSVAHVTTQLPLIYAAEIAQGVERIFWFYMDSSNVKFARLGKQWGFFDAMMEPMPQLVAYDAMTEMLGNARHISSWGSGNTGGYAFSRDDESVVALVYNTSGGLAVVEVPVTGMQTATVYNVYGNYMQVLPINGGSVELKVSEHPVYVVFER